MQWQYYADDTTPVITTLEHFEILKISGPDATSFLQGQISCDIKKLNATTSSLGAHCNPKGRIIANFRIWQNQKNYFLLLPNKMCAILLEHIKKYAVFSKVVLEKIDNAFVILEFILKNDSAAFSHGLNLSTDFSSLTATPDGIFICTATQPLRYLYIASTSQAKSFLQATLQEAKPVRASIWQDADIRNKIAWITPATTEKHTPHDIHLTALDGVSFSKGCYVGQEIIARIHYLGKLKQQLQVIKIKVANQHGIEDSSTILGESLYDAKGHAIGTIINYSVNREQEIYGLAVIKNRALNDAIYWPHRGENFLVRIEP